MLSVIKTTAGRGHSFDCDSRSAPPRFGQTPLAHRSPPIVPTRGSFEQYLKANLA